MSKQKFISCDWGTSALRLRLVDIENRTVLAEAESRYGIAATHELWKINGESEEDRLEIYLSVLYTQLESLQEKSKVKLKNIPMIISGMACSSIGMIELPYKEMPFSLDGSDLEVKTIHLKNDFDHDLFMVSGARTSKDVMRGEETQLIGCIENAGDNEQLFIFTGTHSKHVMIKDKKAIDIRTYMTGELFDLLSRKSVLANNISESTELITKSFEKGIADDAEMNLLHSLFMIRANSLLDKASKEENYSYLNGLLIGHELKEIKNITNPIVIVGNERLRKLYKAAAVKLGISDVKYFDAGEAIVNGHSKIFKAYL